MDEGKLWINMYVLTTLIQYNEHIMKRQKNKSVTTCKLTLVFVLFVFAILLISSTANAAETVDSQNGLLEAIRSIISESIGDLSKNIQSLRDEVQTLRTEVRQIQASNSLNTLLNPNIAYPSPVPVSPPAPPLTLTKTLISGDSGSEVKRLQELLIQLGFNIQAGATGNFGAQTEEALGRIQNRHGLPVTGALDRATIGILNDLLRSQPGFTPPPLKPTQTIGESGQPVITPGLRLVAPQDGVLVNSGVKVPIIWKAVYAPAGSLVKFRLKNKLYGTEQYIHESEELSGTFEWVTPLNRPGDNELTAELFYKLEGTDSPTLLASQTIVVAILGGTSETTTNTSATNTTDSSGGYSNQNYADFYKGTAFKTCMSAYPETLALISDWLGNEWVVALPVSMG